MRNDASFSAAGRSGFRHAENRAAARFLENRLAGARIHHVLRHLAKQLLQAVRAAGVQPAFAGAVGVDVGDRLLLELRLVLLRPFGRAEQSPLFAIPQRQDDRARRTPAGFQQLAEAARRLHQRRRAADRIVGAHHPRIVVIAEDDPLVGPRRAGNARHHVVERTVLPLERQFHVQLRRTRTDVIGHRQRAAPFLRRDRALQLLQDRQRVAIADRQHRDLQDRRRIFALVLVPPASLPHPGVNGSPG